MTGNKDISTKNFTFFITNVCNAFCKHCFYASELNQAIDELTFTEIKKILFSIRTPSNIIFTGGEIFTRQDISDICLFTANLNLVNTIVLATNGFYALKLINLCENLLTQTNIHKISVQISIDGPERIHNQIRGNKNGYQNVIKSAEGLSALQKMDDRLEISLCTTIMQDNKDFLEELIFDLQRIKVQQKFLLFRGEYSTFRLSDRVSSNYYSSNEDQLIVPVEELVEIINKIIGLNNSLDYRFLSEFQIKKALLSLEILQAGKRLSSCLAGSTDFVIYPDGNMAICENTIPIGNLRDSHYDVEHLIRSQKAANIRSKTKSCACLNGCNLYTGLSSSKNEK